MRQWLCKRMLVLTLALTLTALSPISNAAAEPSDNAAAPARGAIAQFEGRPINLSENWGEARACLILRQGNECFRTPEAMEAREAQLGLGREQKPSKGQDDGAVTASYSYSCSSSLRLFDYNWYGGRRLSFWDRGYWQNLWLYGFEDSTSSYAVGSCYVHLAEHSDGYGWWYPGPTYPWAGEPVMSWGWDNRVSSIYIE